jgi:hypothetical protein
MWDVDPTFDLPEGFSLKEDTHFVYLFYHGQKVRVFNAGKAAPASILKACRELMCPEEE